MVKRYAGTRLGRQELDGEIVEDRADALWSRAMIEACRVSGGAGFAAHRGRGRSAGLGIEGRGCLRPRRRRASRRAASAT